MGDEPQSPPQARADPNSSGGGDSQSAPSSPSSPFAHLVHRTSFIDLEALASPDDEDEDRRTEWSTFVDDSPTQRRRKMNSGQLSSQFVSPAEERAIRSGSKSWARPGSDFVPPLLPELSDIDAEGKEAKGTAGSKGDRDFAPVSSNFSDENEEAMGEAGSNSTSGSMFSIFSAGSGGNESSESQGTVRFFQSDSSANGPGSVHSYRSKSNRRSTSGTGARRTSSAVRSILSVESDDQSSTTPQRSGSGGHLKRQRRTEPNERCAHNHEQETIKFLSDDTRTEVTDGSDRSVVGDLMAADIPLDRVHMSYLRSNDIHMAEDFDEQQKKRKIGLGCILLFLVLANVALTIGLIVSMQKNNENGGSTAVAGQIGPVGGAAVVPDANSSFIPSASPLTQAPTFEPETADPSLNPVSAVPSSNPVTPAPSSNPITSEPSADDSETPDSYTNSTNLSTTAGPSPTASPTNRPSLSPTEKSTTDWLLSLLMEHSPYPERLVDRGSNAQKRAYMWLAEDPNVREYSVRRILQRWVLATAFFSQKDPWLWSDWKKHPNECYWTGIRCSFMNKVEDLGGEWVVTSIKVAHSFLEGVIPEEISLLDQITELNLHGNAFLAHGFHGTIPTEIGKLQYLEYLNLSSNNFEGTVPTELANLPKLVDLRLARNSLVGGMPQELCHRGNICYLSADCKEVECDYGCCTRCCTDGGLCCNGNGWCFF